MNDIICTEANNIWTRLDSLEKHFVINFELVLDLKTRLHPILIKKESIPYPIEDVCSDDVSDLYLRIYDIEKRLIHCNTKLNDIITSLDI